MKIFIALSTCVLAVFAQPVRHCLKENLNDFPLLEWLFHQNCIEQIQLSISYQLKTKIYRRVHKAAPPFPS